MIPQLLAQEAAPGHIKGSGAGIAWPLGIAITLFFVVVILVDYYRDKNKKVK